jgi:hypothetical protein
MIFKKNGLCIENIKQESENKIDERYSSDIKKKLISSSYNTFTNINFLKQEKDQTNTNQINSDGTSLPKLKNMNKASPVKLHAINLQNENNINIINLKNLNKEELYDNEDNRNSDFFLNYNNSNSTNNNYDNNNNYNTRNKEDFIDDINFKALSKTERNYNDSEDEKLTPFSK